MYQIKINDMDLKQIADSGQCFTWNQAGENRWAIQAFGRYLEVEQEGGLFSFSCDAEEFNQIWRSYFDLERDYGALKRGVDPGDECLCAAVVHGGGIRVLRQDLWEVMVCFLISQNNNISRIRNSIRLLCQEYGQRLPRRVLKAVAGAARPASGSEAATAEAVMLAAEKAARVTRAARPTAGEPETVAGEPGVIAARGGSEFPGEETYFAFPSPDELSRATVEEFAALGLGYRAKYMKALAEQMKDGGLERLRTSLEKAEDEEAREILMGCYGIGRKVADCICLFGLHRVDMFPVDTHIRKIVDRHYGEAGFPFERYAGSLGIIQQYLFYYDLKG